MIHSNRRDEFTAISFASAERRSARGVTTRMAGLAGAFPQVLKARTRYMYILIGPTDESENAVEPLPLVRPTTFQVRPFVDRSI